MWTSLRRLIALVFPTLLLTGTAFAGGVVPHSRLIVEYVAGRIDAVRTSVRAVPAHP